MDKDLYRFANLSIHPDLIQEIEQLESKCKDVIGEPITLIAYIQDQQSRQEA